jgi:tRNA pseudouridine38-40 synthase
VAHLEVRSTVPPETLRRRINDALPADIHVLEIARAPHRFHARHAAVGRSYLYQVSRRRTAFAKPFVWWVKEPLDIAAMSDAARSFAGRHDFQSFSDDDPAQKSTAVLVDSVSIAAAGDLILVRVVGSHFLWKMVRRIVGVLVEVGRGGIPAGQIEEWLHRPSGAPAKLTAPASGLFLERVFYEGDEQSHPLLAAVPVPAANR